MQTMFPIYYKRHLSKTTMSEHKIIHENKGTSKNSKKKIFIEFITAF